MAALPFELEAAKTCGARLKNVSLCQPATSRRDAGAGWGRRLSRLRRKRRRITPAANQCAFSVRICWIRGINSNEMHHLGDGRIRGAIGSVAGLAGFCKSLLSSLRLGGKAPVTQNVIAVNVISIIRMLESLVIVIVAPH
jgi:hypothetical protein